MGQKIESAGGCDYCGDEKKAVFATSLYGQEEDPLEVHCNTCRASWEADGTPRALPTRAKLEALGVLDLVIQKGLLFTEQPSGEWYRDYSKRVGPIS